MNNQKPVIGIIGAGRLGTAVARQALKAHYHVNIANAHDPQSLTLMIGILLPGAHAATVHDVVQESDIIILAIPLHQYTTLPPELFKNKIVIDAMNYWPPTEGVIKEFSDKDSTSSEYIQSYLPDAIVIKTLNHVAYHELEEDSSPTNTPNRRAIALAGNDQKTKEQVAQLINDVGFDPVDLGLLKEGKNMQPDTALFNARLSAQEIKKMYT